jgi:hypothetical protein
MAGDLTNPYMEAITAKRSLMLTEEEALAGNVTISLETQSDELDNDLFTSISEHPSLFFHSLRALDKRDQEILLAYYLIGSNQTTLAIMHHTTQTLMSYYLRMSTKRIGTHILMGQPTEQGMAEILNTSGLELHTIPSQLNQTVNVEVSKAIALYAVCRSYDTIAKHFTAFRPELRRRMRVVTTKLLESTNHKTYALGAYVFGLIDRTSATSKGLSQRQKDKQGHIFKIDSPILGDFRIDLQHPDFDQVFVSKAIQ